MKKTLPILLILISFSTSLFSQAKSIAILLTSDTEQNTEIDYNKTVNAFFTSHLKKLPNVVISELDEKVTDKAKEEIGNDSGKFSDALTVNAALTKGIKDLVVIYYSATLLENEMSAGGVKKISYGCRLNFYIQIVNTSTGEVTTSKQFYGSVGTAIATKVNYKTKDEAVKAAFETSGPADYRDNTTINVDNYFKKALSL
jgi:hypothetical protein